MRIAAEAIRLGERTGSHHSKIVAAISPFAAPDSNQRLRGSRLSALLRENDGNCIVLAARKIKHGAANCTVELRVAREFAAGGSYFSRQPLAKERQSGIRIVRLGFQGHARPVIFSFHDKSPLPRSMKPTG
jgi:hypothetical protein